MKIKFGKIAAAAALAAVMAIGGLGGRAWADVSTAVQAGTFIVPNTFQITTAAPYTANQTVNISAQVTDQAESCFVDSIGVYAGFAPNGVLIPSNNAISGTAQLMTANDGTTIADLELICYNFNINTDYPNNGEEETVNLDVNGDGVQTGPTAPTDFAGVLQSDGSIKLTWTASTGGSGIYYVVSWQPSSTTAVHQSDHISGTTYTIPAGSYSTDNNATMNTVGITAYSSSGLIGGGTYLSMPGILSGGSGQVVSGGHKNDGAATDNSSNSSSSAKKSDASGIGKTGVMNLTGPALILGGGAAAILAAWLIGRKISKISARR
ncbi:MAG: fibronectin type III domain-containing protein [Candidatus Nomurabacteria bacterium]|jgi:hypothetical protein|nr:fibronectin type III domain-containing protein [Candidatus Nomurabacteria bacterium]